MKKFLTLVCAVAVAGALGTASAMDRSGKFGLGYQETFSSGLNIAGANTNMGAWSLKYGISPELTAQMVFGFDYFTKSMGNKVMNVGGRVLYNLTKGENSAFYTGLGVLASIDKNNNLLRMNIPLGFEFSFAGLPEIGFSAEAGLMWDYMLSGANKGMQLSSVGGLLGGALGLGVHYYF